MTDRRSFVAWLGTLAAALQRPRASAASPEAPGPTLPALPTALYRQPDGRSNLIRITVTGLDAPAARARVTDRRGTLVGTAGLLPDEGGTRLAGEVWVPLAEPTPFQIDLEVGKQRVVRQRVRLVPPRRWTLYWIASSHTDLGLTDLRDRCVELHRRRGGRAAHGRVDGVPPAVLVGGARRQPRAALAQRSLRRRAALRLQRRGSGDGAPSHRLAALGPSTGRAGLPVRRGAPVGRGARQRARGRARDRERHRVQSALRVSPAAGGAPGGFLPRCGAPLRSEAAGAPWRYRLLPRGRRGLHRPRARPLPRRPARRPGGRAAGAVGRENRARGERRRRADRATGRAAPPDVARPARVRGAHVGRGDERVGSRRRADGGPVAVQAARAGTRRGRGRHPGRGCPAAHRPERPRRCRARRIQRVELDAERRAPRARWRGTAARQRRQ